MILNRKVESMLIGILVIAAIASGIAFLDSGGTGMIVGIPQSCKAAINIDAPSSLDFTGGETASVPVTVTKVTCGVSYVRLALNGIPKEFYGVGPTYISVISPSTPARQFMIYFDIPPSAEGKSYTGVYTIYSNEGTYTFGELTINVKSNQKPELFIQPTSRSSAPEVPESVAVLTWYGVVFFASFVSLILVGYEYFVLSRKHGFASALKRSEGSIYKALGSAPEKKASFGAAFKKRSRKR